jgi:ABC-type branched-subunit amino acid transport system ATPase component
MTHAPSPSANVAASGSWSALADRAYVMRRGRLVLEGTARELSSRIEEIGSIYLSGTETGAA